MGRASRRKQERRKDPFWRGMKAEERGRRVPHTVEGCEGAVRARGPTGLGEVLFARHNLRWENVYRRGSGLINQVLPVLAPAAPILATCGALGADWDRPPADPSGPPADHLAWAVDGITAAVRLTLLGQAFGAAAIVRSQLERWTFNLAFCQEIEFTQAELGTDAMRDVWGIQERKEEDVAGTWSVLSELMHGRGELRELARWEAVDLLAGDPPSCLDILVAAMRPALRQIRSVAVGLATDEELVGATRLLGNWPEMMPIEIPFDCPPAVVVTVGLWPMLNMHVDDFNMVALAPPSARLRASLTPLVADGQARFRPSESPCLVLLDHRYRAWQSAGRAFSQERNEVGDLFDPQVLRIRMEQLVMTVEAATLTSVWSQQTDGADSLWVAAAALRSAFFLWLEDDDRAMACVRTALESIAQARAVAYEAATRGSSQVGRDHAGFGSRPPAGGAYRF